MLVFMYSAIAGWSLKRVRSPFWTFSINDLRLNDSTAFSNSEGDNSSRAGFLGISAALILFANHDITCFSLSDKR